MNTSERRARDAEIARHHRSGESEAAIGRRYGLHPTRVRTILVARGLVQRTEARETEGIWAKDEDARVRAIYARQQKGAREALRAMMMEGRST